MFALLYCNLIILFAFELVYAFRNGWIGECWENGSRAIRAASLAAASQCLRTFCAFLKDEAEDVRKSAPIGLISIAQASAVYNEVIPVMQYLCSRLIEPKYVYLNCTNKCINRNK